MLSNTTLTPDLRWVTVVFSLLSQIKGVEYCVSVLFDIGVVILGSPTAGAFEAKIGAL